jgi:uncharacterized protein (TIGR04255 family)
MTSAFHPVNDDHAIERVAFSITFDREFDEEDIASLRRRHKLWHDDLPALREPTFFRIVLGPDAKPQATSAPAAEFAVLRPDGSAVWSLRFVGSEVIVECSRYTRWEKIWTLANKQLKKALDVLASPEAQDAAPRKAIKASLVVQDAFVTHQGIGDTAALIKPSSSLPEFIFSTGPQWHVHSGRFIDTEGDGVLSIFNVEAVLQAIPFNDENTLRQRVSMVHVLSADCAQPVEPNDDVFIKWLGDKMDQFHACNKAMLVELLDEQVAQKIGLLVGVET